MSQWHREHPELAGTDRDPWMQHASYRHAMSEVKAMSGDYCRVCEEFLESGERVVCADCKQED